MSIMGINRLIVTPDGKVVIPGMDYEGRKLTVHQRSRDYLIVKVSSGTGWSGNYQPRRYVAAMFEVYRITGKSKPNGVYLGTRGEEIPVDQLIDFPVRKEK
jgi:hypothetical protein